MNDEPASTPPRTLNVSPAMQAHLKWLRAELAKMPLSRRVRVVQLLKEKSAARLKARGSGERS